MAKVNEKTQTGKKMKYMKTWHKIDTSEKMVSATVFSGDHVLHSNTRFPENCFVITPELVARQSTRRKKNFPSTCTSTRTCQYPDLILLKNVEILPALLPKIVGKV